MCVHSQVSRWHGCAHTGPSAALGSTPGPTRPRAHQPLAPRAPCAPAHPGLEAPAEAQSFFDSLYRAGRLRAFAGAGWAAHQSGGPRSVTAFQRQAGALAGWGFAWNARAFDGLGRALQACPRRRPPRPPHPRCAAGARRGVRAGRAVRAGAQPGGRVFNRRGHPLPQDRGCAPCMLRRAVQCCTVRCRAVPCRAYPAAGAALRRHSGGLVAGACCCSRTPLLLHTHQPPPPVPWPSGGGRPRALCRQQHPPHGRYRAQAPPAAGAARGCCGAHGVPPAAAQALCWTLHQGASRSASLPPAAAPRPPLPPAPCLQRLGWQAVAVPFYEWWHLSPDQQAPYMRRKLQEAGLHLPAGGELPGAAGTQQQRRPEQAEQRQGQGQPVAVRQQRNVEEQPAGQVAPQPPVQPPVQQEQQQRAAAEQPAGSSARGQPEEDASAAGLTQRAQRLSMMQYRQGKLSKAGLLARGSMQAAAAGGKPAPAGPEGSRDGSRDGSSSGGGGGGGGSGDGGGAPGPSAPT